VSKWITIAGALLVVVVLFLLRAEVMSPGAHAEATAAPAQALPAPAAAPVVTAAPAPVAPTAPGAPAAPAAPRKLDPQSDAFFYKFDEVVPARLTRAAATCYEGATRVHRNQKLKLGFKTKIVAGEVSVIDVKVLDSTLAYPGLEACFIRQVAAQHWHDDSLPDWEQDDQLVLRPERGMKKYMRENLEYEGDGPTGAALIKAGQAAPTSDSATASAATAGGHDDDW
jgi:hypothetical protein